MRRGGWYRRFEPTTQRGPVWYERLRQVVTREPELQAEQIAERFGLTEKQAWFAKRLVSGCARRLP